MKLAAGGALRAPPTKRSPAGRLVRSVAFISGGFGVGSILVRNLPVCSGSITMVAAASVGLSVSGKLMTLGHLVVQLRRPIIRVRTIAR
jgi:hypothetical protein